MIALQVAPFRLAEARPLLPAGLGPLASQPDSEGPPSGGALVRVTPRPPGALGRSESGFCNLKFGLALSQGPWLVEKAAPALPQPRRGLSVVRY
jgi:hypothetical protein